MQVITYDPIPKIVHQIWLGEFEPPLDWMMSWKEEFCKEYGWEYKLWRDSDIKEMSLTNKDAFEKSVSYQQKSDIARYEIMYRHGGLYADCDMIWLGNSLEKFLPFNSKMFIGVMESPSPSMNKVIPPPFIANGFFITPKHHRILKKCIYQIPERIRMNTEHAFVKTGPVLLNICIDEPIILIPHQLIFPLDFHFKHGIKNPRFFKEKALVFTYNGADYPHMKKLEALKTTGKCSGPNCN